jgi:hypothetical protein
MSSATDGACNDIAGVVAVAGIYTGPDPVAHRVADNASGYGVCFGPAVIKGGGSVAFSN